MAYVKQNFRNNQTLNAEHLNYMEDGIARLSKNNVVDLAIFMGQSNMAGRGVTSTAHPETAPIVPEGHGYEFKAISDPTKLYNIVEPFGVKENKSTGVDDGTKKTGSMVSAFANSYYAYAGVPIVGVSCSKGGSNIRQWLPDSTFLNDAITRYNTAKTWLINNGYTIRKQFMVWCQGEADGKNIEQNDHSDLPSYDYNMYINFTKTIVEKMMEYGVEKCFVIRIGQYVGDINLHTNMIHTQTDMCQSYENTVLVATDFASFVEAGLMKDEQHYLQEGYNIVGTSAGKHTAFYINNGLEPYMYDPEFNNTYIPYSISNAT